MAALMVAATVGLAIVLYLLGDFLRRERSSQLSLGRQLRIYAVLRIMDLVALYYGWRFEQTTRNFMEEQRQLIERTLRVNAGTEYGRDHQLAAMRSLEDFRARHPVTEYRHYARYIAAAERGQEDALLADDDVLLFGVSSGTTGGNKHVPVCRREIRHFLGVTAGVFAPAEWRFGGGAIGRTLGITSRPSSAVSASGKPICSLALMLQRSPLSQLRAATPACVEEVHSEVAAVYLALLFALLDPQLHGMFCNFIQHFLSAMHTLERHWPTLVAELAAGHVGDHLLLPPDLLARVNTHLAPAPRRAAELRAHFGRGFEMIVARVWPRLRFVQAARGGLAGATYTRLARRYLGEVPVLDVAYCSTEARLGINLAPAAAVPTFTLLGRATLFEFLPVEDQRQDRRDREQWDQQEQGDQRDERDQQDKEDQREEQNQQKQRNQQDQQDQQEQQEQQDQQDQQDQWDPLAARLLLADQVRVGAEYELVVTNATGLYRYRIGDVVRVCGFHNQAPVVEFRYRAGQLLSVKGEKVSERALFKAMEAAAASWPDTTLVEFTAAESLIDPTSSGSAPYYLFFLATTGSALTKEQTAMVDTCLQRTLENYRRYRASESIGPARVRQVASGAFQRLRQAMTARSQAHWSQMKTPRVLRRTEDVALMLAQALPDDV
ncbi:probable indole-3-acetic acid-amido synthetase GH3.12 [Pollicipes pollicipes]|uniref:probable indole-3-acetic acid-amido synthetase GH3.12 n=1 Tax=Pollicipes pollicipes TaxID=41117 RepID=UPI0018857BF1|nr:probable indole-3-acetic acid-amido synthetase GH3.12 [Pollicipes pollicipes]